MPLAVCNTATHCITPFMHPKLYYVPGIISLLMLFPLFYYTAQPKLHPPTVAKFYLPMDEATDSFTWMFSLPYIEELVQSKQQTKFWLGEEEAHKKFSLQMIQQEALQLKLTHDTNRVVAAVLLPAATFEDFVSLINICLINENKRYALARDTFYFFADPPPNSNLNMDSFFICGRSNLSEQPLGKPGKINKYFTQNILPYWYWCCCYAALVSVAIVSIKRRYWPSSPKKISTPH